MCRSTLFLLFICLSLKNIHYIAEFFFDFNSKYMNVKLKNELCGVINDDTKIKMIKIKNKK